MCACLPHPADADLRVEEKLERERLATNVLQPQNSVSNLGPPGCEPDSSAKNSQRSYATIGYALRIEPRRRAVASKAGIFAMSPPHTGSPNYPHLSRMAVSHARRNGRSYTQIQVGIDAVFLGDGTAWPTKLNYFLRNYNATNPSRPVNCFQASVPSNPDRSDLASLRNKEKRHPE